MELLAAGVALFERELLLLKERRTSLRGSFFKGKQEDLGYVKTIPVYGYQWVIKFVSGFFRILSLVIFR